MTSQTIMTPNHNMSIKSGFQTFCMQMMAKVFYQKCGERP